MYPQILVFLIIWYVGIYFFATYREKVKLEKLQVIDPPINVPSDVSFLYKVDASELPSPSQVNTTNTNINQLDVEANTLPTKQVYTDAYKDLKIATFNKTNAVVYPGSVYGESSSKAATPTTASTNVNGMKKNPTNQV